jgi:iron complex outermembrane receptor protein
MLRKLSICCIGYFYSLNIYAQGNPDSIPNQLQEVVVKAYLGEQPLYTLPASVTYIDQQRLGDHPNYTLVPVMNTVAGVRMEERSPGSYRLSIRGSLLRSPFGVRNVKMYIDEFPLTDAGGNTYINTLDLSSIAGIEILKGPDGSLFGANSGGVVLLQTENRADTSIVSAGVTGGSYGLLHEKAGVQIRNKNYYFSIRQVYQRSDGYRENSALQKQFLQSTQRWRYTNAGELSVLLFYSNLNYETPAGLTLVQWQRNPRQARPATATFPGAIEQQAAVYNKTFFAGISNEYQITSSLRNVLAIATSHTNFENPFITNYEKRNEQTFSLRSYFELRDRNAINLHWKINLGVEWQNTASEIRNFGNDHGEPDTLQSADELDARQYFYFTRGVVYLFNRITIEAALSLNHYQTRYGALPASSLTTKEFTPTYMPRVAMSYQFVKNMVARASVSKGYSTPTLQEIRSSDQVINTSLQPENAWNYETGLRWQNNAFTIWGDASVFYYRMQDAIVRRVNDNGEEYFVNAGGTKQLGLEFQLNTWLVKRNNENFIRGLLFRNSYTYSHFTFDNYSNADQNYSGNNVTGVPQHVAVFSLHTDFPLNYYLFTQYYFTSRLPLNDANAVYADPYHLVQVKAGWKRKVSAITIELFAGCDNLLNQVYSLGNDLNAVGGRYYNAAPPRNYYGGINVVF